MKEMRIMRAIGEIDDTYIEEAAPRQNRGAMHFMPWARYAGAAAAAVLVTGLGAFAAYFANNNVGVDIPAQTTSVTSQPAVTSQTAETSQPAVTSQTAETSQPATTSETAADTTDEPIVLLSTPFEYYDTLEEAAQAIGFDMTAPESLGKFTERSVATIDGEILELAYYDKDDNRGHNIRKAKGSGDISGDYSIYDFTGTVDVEGRTVTMSGNGDKVFMAVWTDGDFSYSVNTDENGLSQAEMEEIIKNVK